MKAQRFSRIVGGIRVGGDFFERAGLTAAEPPPKGLVGRVEELVGRDVDVRAFPEEVRAFFEDPASLELRIRSRWRGGFRLAWRVMRVVMRAIGQLVLPVDVASVRARMVSLDGAKEGRRDARGVVRTCEEGGEVFQVFAYGVSVIDGDARMSVAIPLPGGHIAGLLRLSMEGSAVTLGTRPRAAGDPSGVWFVTPWWSLRLPLEETLRFWSARDPAAPVAPGDRAWPDVSFVAVHEQRLWGALVVEHTYAFRPRSA